MLQYSQKENSDDGQTKHDQEWRTLSAQKQWISGY
jgi:hypothetical protein